MPYRLSEDGRAILCAHDAARMEQAVALPGEVGRRIAAKAAGMPDAAADTYLSGVVDGMLCHSRNVGGLSADEELRARLSLSLIRPADEPPPPRRVDLSKIFPTG